LPILLTTFITKIALATNPNPPKSLFEELKDYYARPEPLTPSEASSYPSLFQILSSYDTQVQPHPEPESDSGVSSHSEKSRPEASHKHTSSNKSPSHNEALKTQDNQASTSPLSSHNSTPILTPTSLAVMPDTHRVPKFNFCGKFTGKDVSASRWLKSFNHELEDFKIDDTVPPKTFMRYFDLLMSDDAADWLETNPDASRLIEVDPPTSDTVDQIVSLIKERFPSKAVEEVPISFDAELIELRQKPEDTLNTYYSRALNLMQKYGARDRSATLKVLSLAESSLLDTVLRQWVKGLYDSKIKQKAAEGMAPSDRSLRKVYTMATEARRVKLEISKLMEDEAKENDLMFYKNVAERNLTPIQIESMRASYQSGHKVDFSPINRPASTPLPKVQPEAQDQYQAHSQPQRQVMQNTNRGNSRPYTQRSDQQRLNNNYQSNAKRPFQATPKDLPDAKKSKNPYVNGTRTWNRSDGPLCFGCGHLGHVRKDCVDEILPAWEQSYLKSTIFGDASPSSNFAAACYGAFDGAVEPYHEAHKEYLRSSSPTKWNREEPKASPFANSISFGVEGLSLSKVRADSDSAIPSLAVETKYGEGSGPNKRAREDEPSQETLQQTQNSQVPQPQFNQPQFMPEERMKKKGQKKVGKKVEPQPLVGMFNDDQGKYESPISIRTLMKQHRVDISLMDFVAWSPQACRELKRMCTRVAKKREKKQTVAGQQPQASIPPQQTFNPIPQAAQFPSFPQFPILPPIQPQTQQGPQRLPAFTEGWPQNQVQQPLNPQATYNSTQQNVANPPQGASSIDSSSVNVYRTEAERAHAERHTRALNQKTGKDKQYRLESQIRTEDNRVLDLPRDMTQADQGSDICVVSPGLVNYLKLTLHPLADIGFAGLSMRTADNRETVLHFWVTVVIGVAGVWRTIHCFVGPEISFHSDQGQKMTLILGLPWLWLVNAHISIRDSKLFLGDPGVGESVREVIGPEMFFSSEHNMLLYPKGLKSQPLKQPTVEEVDDSSEEDDDSSSSDGDGASDDQAFQ